MDNFNSHAPLTVADILAAAPAGSDMGALVETLTCGTVVVIATPSRVAFVCDIDYSDDDWTLAVTAARRWPHMDTLDWEPMTDGSGRDLFITDRLVAVSR